jgi:hypothetical protein
MSEEVDLGPAAVMIAAAQFNGADSAKSTVRAASDRCPAISRAKYRRIANTIVQLPSFDASIFMYSVDGNLPSDG